MDLISETFFQAMKQGSVDKLKEFMEINGFEETCKLANSLNKHGETPLLLAIGGNDKAMVEFLINNLNASIHQFGRFMWKGVEYLDAPPLFAAIISERRQPKFSWCPTASIAHVLITKEIAHVLITKEMGMDLDDDGSPAIWNFLELSSVPLRQKIDFLLLMGAAYILNFSNDSEDEIASNARYRGLEHIDVAMRLRELTSDGDESALPEVTSHLSEFAREVFGDTVEFTTMEQLLEEIGRTRSLQLLIDQALLISHRILNQIDPDPHPFVIFWILQIRLPPLCRDRQYHRVFKITLLILKMIETPTRAKWKDELCSWPYFNIITRTLDFLRFSFNQMQKESSNEKYRQEDRCFANVVQIIRFLSDYFFKLIAQKPQKDDKCIDYVEEASASIYFLVALFVTEMLPQTSDEEEQQFSSWLNRFIRITNGISDVTTLLHYDCVFAKPQSKTGKHHVIQLLLEAGANPNARDSSGKSPLAYLMGPLSDPINATFVVKKAQQLVDAGAHLDLVLEAEDPVVTVLDCFKEIAVENNCPILQSFVNKNVPLLTCLCAQTIRANRIPFDSQQLPVTLVSFLQDHGVHGVD